jgi:hypothetical protein
MHDWVTITNVFGKSVREPAENDMRAVLQELFSCGDDEHPDAWIECGSNDGPLYCISVFQSGYAIYTKYSDTDMTRELETKKISPVNYETALLLWKSLAAENFQGLIE